MARPFWTGDIRISLVSFGVQLFPATEAKSQITLHEIDRRSGGRIHHRNVAGEDAQVDRSDIVKGYEYNKGEYVVLEPEEIKQLRIPSSKTIEISNFVDPESIDLAYFERPYFVLPDDDRHADTYRVIRKALSDTGRAGIGEIAFGGREHLVALLPSSGKDSPGMVAYTMRYREELRDGEKLFREIKDGKIDSDQLDLAKELIQRNTAKFVPSQYKDDYETALRELIDAKMHHRKLPEAPSPHRAKVINLTDALRKSLASKTASATGKRPPKSVSARASAKRPVAAGRRAR